MCAVFYDALVAASFFAACLLQGHTTKYSATLIFQGDDWLNASEVQFR